MYSSSINAMGLDEVVNEMVKEKKPKDSRTRFQRLFGYCPCCGEWFKRNVKSHRRITQYVDNESNYLTACPDCRLDDDDYWAMRWEDYYSGLL